MLPCSTLWLCQEQRSSARVLKRTFLYPAYLHPSVQQLVFSSSLGLSVTPFIGSCRQSAFLSTLARCLWYCRSCSFTSHPAIPSMPPLCLQQTTSSEVP